MIVTGTDEMQPQNETSFFSAENNTLFSKIIFPADETCHSEKALENGRIDIHIQLKKDDDANSFDEKVQL